MQLATLELEPTGPDFNEKGERADYGENKLNRRVFQEEPDADEEERVRWDRKPVHVARLDCGEEEGVDEATDT